MCILWYHRNIKVNPSFLGFLKSSGGVKRPLMSSSDWTLNMPTGVDGETPPSFQFSRTQNWWRA